MGSYRKCNTCSRWEVNDQVRINEINAEIESITMGTPVNALINAARKELERLEELVLPFRIESRVREEQRMAESFRFGEQIAAAFESRQLEDARTAEIEQLQETEKKEINKEHLVIAGAGIIVASVIL